MGLDMYLYGEKSVSSQFEKDRVMEDGFTLGSKTLDIAYWRKHANLHGYIVDTFADGKDDCQRIYLFKDNLSDLIEALESDALYKNGEVTGFFFGRSYFPGEKDDFGSYEEQKANDLKIFRSALDWVSTDANDYRSVYYQSSW